MPHQPQSPASAPTATAASALADQSTDGTRYRVRLLPSQRQFEASPTETLLHAAEHSGLSLPSSCRNGTCRTCICKAHSGSVHYLVEWPGLSLEEKADGYVLPCVALATSDIVLEQAEAI